MFENPCTFIETVQDGPNKFVNRYEIAGTVGAIRIQGEIPLGKNFAKIRPAVYWEEVTLILNKCTINILDDDLEQAGYENQAEGAFSVNFVLKESHLHIHTWPEVGLMQYDISLCNYFLSNDDKAREATRQIAELFQSPGYQLMEIRTIAAAK